MAKGRRREGQSTWKKAAGNKVKLEQDCEGIGRASTGSVGS